MFAENFSRIEFDPRATRDDYKTRAEAIDAFESLQARRVIEIPFLLTSAERVTLDSSLPGVLFKTVPPVHHTLHNVLQAARIHDEMVVYEKCLALGRVADVGGNLARHRNLARRIHCMNPVIDASDVIRGSSRGSPDAAVTQCRHRLQECRCGGADGFDALMFIHSAYYLSPQDLFDALQRTSSKVAYAVIHDTPGVYGEIAGEAAYWRQEDDSIRFHAKGQGADYVHPDTAWMRNNGAAVDGGAVVAAVVVKSPISTTYIIRATTERINIHEATFVTPDVSHRLVHMHQGRSHWLLGGGLYGPSGVVPMAVLNDGLRFIAGRPRTDVTMAALTGLLRKSFATHAPALAEAIADSLPLAIGYCFMRGLGSEIRVMHAVNERKDQIEALNGLLRLGGVKYDHWGDAKRAALGLFSVAVAAHAVATARSYKNGNYVEPGAIVRRAAVIGALAGSTGAVLGWVFGKPLSILQGVTGQVVPVLFESVLRALRELRTSCTLAFNWVKRGRLTAAEFRREYVSTGPRAPETAVVELVLDRATADVNSQRVGVRLPAMDTRLTGPEIAALPTDPEATVRVIEPIVDREEQLLVPWGIFSMHTVCPGVLARSAINVDAAFKIRLVSPSPYDNPLFSPGFVELYRAWVRRNFDEFGIVAPERALRFDEWRDKYSLSIRRKYDKAKADNDAAGELSRRHYNRGLFLKVEATLKYLPGLWQGTKPRVIQSADEHLNARVGPALAAVGRALSDAWSPRSDSPWVYLSKGTPREFGAAYQAHLEEHSGLAALRNDCSDYDHSQSPAVLEIPLDVMSRLTVNMDDDGLMDVLRAKVPLVGWYQNRGIIRVAMRGMMHSGDQDTSTTNTLQNGMFSTFVLALWLARRHHTHCLECGEGSFPLCHRHATLGGLLLPTIDSRAACRVPSPRATMEFTDARMFLAGDDNVTVANRVHLPPPAFVSEMHSRAGFTAKPIIVDDAAHGIACSGYFWPTTIGLIMGPRLGRAIAKFGWLVSPPNYNEKTLNGIIRGDALGRGKTYAWLPFARKLYRRVVELTASTRATLDPHTWSEGWYEDYSRVEPNDATWQMIYDLYGLTQQHELEYEAVLASVTSLPTMVNFAPLHRAIAVDTIEEDPDESFPF